MRSTERERLAVPLVVLAAAVTAVALPGIAVRATYGAHTTADEPQYLLTALSIGEGGSLDIGPELRAERWRNFHEAELPRQTRPLPGGREVSPHDPGLPLLLALPMRVGGWMAAKAAMAVLLGVLAAVTAWTAVRRFGVRPRTALPVVGLLTASAPLAVYGTQIYPEVPAALALVTAVAATAGRLHRGELAVLAASVVALPWLAVKYAPVAAVVATLAVVRLWQAGRRWTTVALVATLAAAGVVYVAVHVAVYTGITPYAAGDHFVGGELTAVGSSPNYLGRSRRLMGLLVDREFGIAAWQPAWFLVVPAVAWIVARRTAGWPLLVLPLAVGWLTATFAALTMHGYWFPGRQVVVVLPLAMLLLAIAGEGQAWARWGVLAAGAAGVLTYMWLIAAGVGGDIALIVDFPAGAGPLYSVWSRVLPGYRVPDAATWPLHLLWLALTAATVAMTWRAARCRGEGAGVTLASDGPRSL